MAAGDLVPDPGPGLDEGGDGDRGVVHQSLADSGQIRARLDAELGERHRRADSGPEQMRRRVDRARGDDDLARSELFRPARHLGLDADAAGALEQQLLDLRVGRDLQVLAQPGARIEIADCRGDAALVGVRDGDREVAVAKFAVLVGQVFVAGAAEGLARGGGVAVPKIGHDAAHRDAARLAVIGPVEIHVALELLEIGQHRVPVPAPRAARFPLVVVARRTPVGELTVDRGAAAEHAGLLVFAQRRPLGIRIVVADRLGGDLELGPMEASVEIGGAGIAVEDLLRHLAVGGVLAGLEQQDLVGAPGREPIGQHRAGRAAADDNVVVNHAVSSSPSRGPKPGRHGHRSLAGPRCCPETLGPDKSGDDGVPWGGWIARSRSSGHRLDMSRDGSVIPRERMMP